MLPQTAATVAGTTVVMAKKRANPLKQTSLPLASQLVAKKNSRSTGIEAPAAKRLRKSDWVRDQYTIVERIVGGVDKGAYECSHCSKQLTGTNTTRLKSHLMDACNSASGGFLSSDAAASLAHVPEVQAALSKKVAQVGIRN